MNNFYKAFVSVGAIQSGHFELSSGLHSDTHFNAMAVINRPHRFSFGCSHDILVQLGRAGVINIEERSANIHAVIGPVTCGSIFANWLAATHTHSLSIKKHEVIALVADTKPVMALRRRQSKLLKPGSRLLLADDALTKGGTIKKLVAYLQDFDVEIIAAAFLCNRSVLTAKDLGVPAIVSLVTLEGKEYQPGNETCPMCKADIPLDKDLGHGR